MTERQPITVSALNLYIKTLISGDDVLREVYVSGEISSFKRHAATGHLYFDLKDDTGSVRAIMFSAAAQKLGFNPENGMKVLVKGRVSVYEAAGTYQIYISSMEPEGLGSLYMQFLALKNKLEAEGLFSQARKRKIKKLPKVVAVITSKSGAVIRDIENVLSRRYPLCKILLFPASVQGDTAAETIVSAFDKVNATPGIDTVILARGGGSQLDLWCFNDERVARAIASCRYPVISAVGHETDFTIADFVADLRAPTPSAAAENAASDIKDITVYLKNAEYRLMHGLKGRIDAGKTRLDTAMSHPFFRETDRFFGDKLTEVIYLTERISRCSDFYRQKETELTFLKNRLDTGIRTCLNIQEERIGRDVIVLGNGIRRTVDLKAAEIEKYATRLLSLDPMAILSRGYGAITKDGKIINDAEAISVGDKINVRLHDGSVDAVVMERKLSDGKNI